MNPSITTLALNLLISERKSQRIHFSGRILDAVQFSGSIFKNLPELMDNLVLTMKACIENPNCEARDDFYKFAKFCDEKISSDSNLSAA